MHPELRKISSECPQLTAAEAFGKPLRHSQRRKYSSGARLLSASTARILQREAPIAASRRCRAQRGLASNTSAPSGGRELPTHARGPWVGLRSKRNQSGKSCARVHMRRAEARCAAGAAPAGLAPPVASQHTSLPVSCRRSVRRQALSCASATALKPSALNYNCKNLQQTNH